MLMMRLQRVGRRNDPAYRIVVTDKRTGPKSDKHVARLGSYNPKMDHIQLDKDAAKDWISKGVQPSDTVHNLLVSQGVIDGKKINVLPKKSPIIDEEAIKKAEEEAAAKAEAHEKVVESGIMDINETIPEAEDSADETADTPVEEAPAEESAEETPAEPDATEESADSEEKKD